MLATRSRRASALAVIASVAMLLSVAGPAAADGGDPAFVMDFPAPQACQDFDLRITGYGEGQQVFREFSGPGGSVRYLAAGTGNELTYTNLTSGAEISTRSNGAVGWTTVYPDGSQRLSLLGHNVVILFPTDVGGPGTTVYTGRVTIDVSADGVWDVTAASGNLIDICEALAS